MRDSTNKSLINNSFILVLLILNDNSLIARYNYALKTNYLFIHYTMLRVTNMLSDSARKTNERDKCSKSAGSTRHASSHC